MLQYYIEFRGEINAEIFLFDEMWGYVKYRCVGYNRYFDEFQIGYYDYVHRRYFTADTDRGFGTLEEAIEAAIERPLTDAERESLKTAAKVKLDQ